MCRRREKQKNTRFELDDLALADSGRPIAKWGRGKDDAQAALPGSNAHPFTAKSEKEPEVRAIAEDGISAPKICTL